ncbi:MAG: histidinol-phosphatase, partial [Actinobacteria bacterium]|nr:histidinol-phosphatase [Actinomycetota bacterium]
MTLPPPGPPADQTMLANAVDILRVAGAFTMQWFDNPALDITTKSDGTPVTEADRGAEQIVRDRL